jgi:hypothetical protein
MAVTPEQVMARFVDHLIETMQNAKDARSVDDALLDAAFLFEKARGMQPCGWTPAVEQADITPEDALRLRKEVIQFVERQHAVRSR